jgi:hypothetical protein
MHTCKFQLFFYFTSSTHVRFHIRFAVIQRRCPSAPEKKLPTSGKPTTVTRNESLLLFKMLIISVQWLFQVLKQCKKRALDLTFVLFRLKS